MRFERRENKNYAVDEHTEADLKQIAFNMIKNQVLQGLLPVRFRYVDDHVLAEYDITGLHPLSRIYERKKMKSKDIMEIIKAVYMAAKEMEEYLLTWNDLCFNPDLIFTQAEGVNYLFCALLCDNPDTDNNLGELGRFILDKVDYDDKESVGLAYQVVKAIDSENQEENLLKIINEEKKDEAQSIKEIPEPEKDEFIIMPEFIPKKRRKRWFFKEKKVVDSEINLPVLAEPEVNKDEKNRGRFVTQPLDRQLMEKHYYLQPMDDREHNKRIEIDHFPYVVGKLEEGVDFRPDSMAVSRLHAKFEYGGDGIAIEDLNSSNGTFINGNSVFGRGRVVIKDGDIIAFANQEYRFEVYGRR